MPTLDTALGTAATQSSISHTLTTTATVAPGGMISWVIGAFTGSTIQTPTGGGLTWVAAGTPVVSGSLKIVEFIAFAPGGLSSGTVLTVTLNTATADWLSSAISLLGVDTSGTVVAFNGGSAATAAWATASVAGNPGDALVGGAFCDGLVGTSTPAGTGVEWSDHNSAAQSESHTGVYKLSVAGSDTIAGTWSGAVSHVAIAVALKAAPSGVAFPNIPAPLLMRMGRFMGSGVPILSFLTPALPSAAFDQTVDGTGNGIASAEAFGTDRVDLGLVGTGIASAEAFGSGRVDLSINGTGIASAEAFGTHVVTLPPTNQTITSTGGIASAEAFGSDQVNLGIVGIGIVSLEAFGSGQVNLAINGTGIASAETFGADRVDLSILGTGIPSAEAFGATDQFNLSILGSGILSAEAFGIGTITGGAVGGAGVLSERRRVGYGA